MRHIKNKLIKVVTRSYSEDICHKRKYRGLSRIMRRRLKRYTDKEIDLYEKI